MCLLALLLFGIFLSSVSVYPEEQVPQDGRVAGLPRFTLATQFMYKRAMLWVFVDVLAIVLAYYAGFMLRYGHTPEWALWFQSYVGSAPIAVVSFLLPLAVFGLYRTDWQTFSMHEARIITLGVTLGALTQAAVLWVGFDMGSASLGVTVHRLGRDHHRPDRFTRHHSRARRVGASRRWRRGAGARVRCGSRRRARAAQSCGPTAVSANGSSVSSTTIRHGSAHSFTEYRCSAPGPISKRSHVAQHAAAIVVATRKLTDDRVTDVLRVASRLGLSVYRLAIDLEPLEAPSSRSAALPVRLAKVSQTTPLRR